MKKIETKITIQAPKKKVWNILMNHDAYPKWNPFVKEIKGKAQEGNQIEVTIQPPGGKPMQFKPKVLKNEAEKEFRWRGHLGVKGLFDGEHYFQLESKSPNQTQFTHGETFSGWLVSLILSWIGASTKKGFEEMNQALKEQAEKEA